MATEAEVEWEQLLITGGEGDGGRGLHPILMGLMGLSPAGGETEPPPPGRVVLMNPRSGRMVVLQTDASMISEFLLEGGGRSGPPPASKASIEALRKLDPGDLEPGHECPVCLVEIGGGGEEEEAVCEMPCKHRFHEGCIKKWLGMHGSCPLCRFQMPVEEVEVVTKTEEPPREEEEGEEEQQRPRMMMMSVSITMFVAASQRQGIAETEQQQPRVDNID